MSRVHGAHLLLVPVVPSDPRRSLHAPSCGAEPPYSTRTALAIPEVYLQMRPAATTVD